MKVLVVGSGGREHALAWGLRRSPSVKRVDCAPGNAGIARHARLQAVASDDVAGIVSLARREGYDLVVVGPERPLSLGLADALSQAGVRVFGCSRAASEIEASKAFSKDLMQRHQIPTAEHGAFRDAGEATRFAEHLLAEDGRVVLKADGLAAGKGVVICEDVATIREAAPQLLASTPSGVLVVEAFLMGREASCMALVAGTEVAMLPPCEDHKTIFDGDRGPMTGGMGAVCPTPVVDAALLARVEAEIVRPTARAMLDEGRAFFGLLYAGIMATRSGPKVLEFNARFGDPETQALVARVKGDLAESLAGIAEGRAIAPAFWSTPSCAVVMAARGYPGTPERGAAIEGLEAAEAEGAVVFHAGTRFVDGRFVVDGGRVLAVTATGADARAARERAYEAAAKVRFDGMQVRGDIGARR